MVTDLTALDSYPYSGHSGLMGTCERAWQDSEYVLSMFSNTMDAARTLNRAFVEAIVRERRLTLPEGAKVII